MPKYKRLELSDEDFHDIVAACDTARKNVTLHKETLAALLRDHSTLHDMAKPEPSAVEKESA